MRILQSARKQQTPKRTSPVSCLRRPPRNWSRSRSRASLPSLGMRKWMNPRRTPRPATSRASPWPSQLHPPPRSRRLGRPCHPTGTGRRPPVLGAPVVPSWPPSPWLARPGPYGAGLAVPACRQGARDRERGRRPPACPRGRRCSACGPSRRSPGSTTRRAPSSRNRPPRPAPRPAGPSFPRTAAHRGHSSKQGHPSKPDRRSSRRRGHRTGHPSGAPQDSKSGQGPFSPSRSTAPGQATCESRSAHRSSPRARPSRRLSLKPSSRPIPELTR